MLYQAELWARPPLGGHVLLPHSGWHFKLGASRSRGAVHPAWRCFVTVGRLRVDRPDRGRVSCAIGEGSLVPDVVDPNSQSPRERRAAPRLQVNLPARYNSEATSLLGWVANLSRNGLFLRSDYLDEAGVEVSVSFELPGEPHPVALRGEVVRVNDGALCPGMAIRFTHVPDGVQRKLAMFMQNRHRFANHP